MHVYYTTPTFILYIYIIHIYTYVYTHTIYDLSSIFSNFFFIHLSCLFRCMEAHELGAVRLKKWAIRMAVHHFKELALRRDEQIDPRKKGVQKTVPHLEGSISKNYN